MNAVFLARQPQYNMIGTSANAVMSRRISGRLWCISLVAIGMWSAIIAALITAYVHPAPRVHDEFSYILAADTLLHGRLANPTPPSWQALQSFHTVMQPNYASKYPVGAGLLVAIGWIILGTPQASSWLAVAMLTMSVTWMLSGALPRRWAILGGALIALSPFIQLAWSQSLLHGFLPASGSALVMGGILRLRRRVAFASALASGCGVGLLAISRPFEGLCCTAICAALLWFTWSRHRLLVRIKMAIQAGIFAAPPVLAALLLIAAHNHAVTGNWRQMPYQLHESLYGVAPLFVFHSPKLENTTKRADLPAVFHDYHAVDSLNWYRKRAGMHGWLQGVNDAICELFKLAFPFVGVFAISGLGWTNYGLSRGLVLAVALQVSASACVCWVYSHYLAPILPWLLLLSLLSIRMSLKRRSRVQAQVVRLALFTVLLVQAASLMVSAGIAKSNEAELWARRRQEVVDQLSEAEGKHLILVRYMAEHNVHHEWVYNLADPSASKLVWARYEDGRWLNSLLNEYPDRSVWEIEADDPKPLLKKFEAGSHNNTSDTSGH